MTAQDQMSRNENSYIQPKLDVSNLGIDLLLNNNAKRQSSSEKSFEIHERSKQEDNESNLFESEEDDHDDDESESEDDEQPQNASMNMNRNKATKHFPSESHKWWRGGDLNDWDVRSGGKRGGTWPRSHHLLRVQEKLAKYI